MSRRVRVECRAGRHSILWRVIWLCQLAQHEADFVCNQVTFCPALSSIIAAGFRFLFIKKQWRVSRRMGGSDLLQTQCQMRMPFRHAGSGHCWSLKSPSSAMIRHLNAFLGSSARKNTLLAYAKPAPLVGHSPGVLKKHPHGSAVYTCPARC